MVLNTHPDVEIIKFTVKIEDNEPVEVAVAGADSIDMKVPESSTYITTIYFKANKTLKDFKYTQVLRRAGVVVKTKQVEVGTYEASEEIYAKELPSDITPGGFLFRGNYPATSTYYANGEELYSVDWSLEITKK